MTDPVLLEARGQTGSRTARTAVQGGFAGALVTVCLWLTGADPSAEVVIALVVVATSACAFVQNVWEATIGRRLFERRLPELVPLNDGNAHGGVTPPE